MNVPKVSRSQSPSPPLANFEVEATAYADPLEGTGYYRLGQGLAGIYRHREPVASMSVEVLHLTWWRRSKACFKERTRWRIFVTVIVGGSLFQSMRYVP